MTPTSIIRRPYKEALLSGMGPLTDLIDVRMSHGYDRRMAEATVTLLELPTGILPFDTITINAGASYDTIETRFQGYFVSHERQLYPAQVKLNLKGKLQRADSLKTTSDVILTNPVGVASPVGTTDEEMVSHVLNLVGLNPGWDRDTNPVMDGIEGTGRLLGRNDRGSEYSWITGKGFAWLAGESALSWIERLDAVCLGYRTFDTPSGAIVRKQITSAPAETADFTFEEGVDIYRAQQTTTVLDAKNRITVTGYSGWSQTELDPYTVSGTNFVLWDGTQWFAEEKINSRMIEKRLATDVIGDWAIVGDGISEEEVATWLLGELNRYVERVNLTTPRDDLIQPGDTIEVYSSRLGIDTSRTYWVQGVDVAIDSRNRFSQVLTCLTGYPVAAP
jgi:hypothetical protein